MMAHEDAPPELPKNVEIAYKDSIDNLMFLKRQQWNIARYALAAYAALFVLSATLKTSPQVNYTFMAVISLIALFGCVVLHNFESAIERHRARLRNIYATYFTEDQRKNLILKPGKGTFVQYGFTIGFYSAVVLGAAISLLAIFLSQISPLHDLPNV